MFIILSPAKKQTLSTREFEHSSQIEFKPQTAELIPCLQQLSSSQLKQLMSISDSLADLNHLRFRDFDVKHYDQHNANPAIFMFQGDAYKSLNADSLTSAELSFAQQHLGLLSGLYGLLRPLDLIQPYRLEMKTKLVTDHAKNLYQFWGDDITKLINQRLKKAGPLLVNLASNEYNKVINFDLLDTHYVTIHFKQLHKGAYKSIGILAKRARGLMTRFLVQKQAKTMADIKAFAEDHYRFQAKESDEHNLVFYQN